MTSLTVYSAAVSAAGDSTLIAAPGAGLRICPVLIKEQGNTATADTLLLYDGASASGTKLDTTLAQNQGDGVVLNCIFQCDDGKIRQLKLSENKALVLNKAQAVATNVTVWYYTEAI
jgi:uncharacterized protein (AIM24 family)